VHPCDDDENNNNNNNNNNNYNNRTATQQIICFPLAVSQTVCVCVWPGITQSV